MTIPGDLLERSVMGQAEAFALLGAASPDGVELRRPDAVGARIPWASSNHWADAAVVPPGVAPPADCDALPHCVWVLGAEAPGRVELADIAMPVMAFDLSAVSWSADPSVVSDVDPGAIGALNDLAYGEGETEQLLGAVPPSALHVHGIVGPSGLVACATALDLDDDASVQWVATHPSVRRQGLASRVIRTLLADAAARGRRWALLQASPDGEPLYAHLGFSTLGVLRGFVRP